MARIDAHTHLFAPEQEFNRFTIANRDPTFAEIYASPKAKMAVAGALLETMETAMLTAAVVAGFAFRHERDIETQNDYLLGPARQEGRGKLWPLASVNLALPGWRANAERAILRGARGFGELRPANQGWEPLGRDARALCGLAREAKVPLLWHVSEPVGHAYPGKEGGISPIELCTLATLEPGTKMIAAHLGGGLSFYLQMPEVRAALADCFFDTAAASFLYDEQSISRLVDLAGPERVLFASDFPLQSPRHQLDRLLATLPAEHAALICGRNAEVLFTART